MIALLYKTANHEGDIFLKTSSGVMLTAFVILAFVGVTAGPLASMEGGADGAGRGATARVGSYSQGR